MEGQLISFLMHIKIALVCGFGLVGFRIKGVRISEGPPYFTRVLCLQAAVHAVPVSTDPSRGPAGAAAAGLYAVSYGNGTDPHHQQQPQQQSYAYQTTYR